MVLRVKPSGPKRGTKNDAVSQAQGQTGRKTSLGRGIGVGGSYPRAKYRKSHSAALETSAKCCQRTQLGVFVGAPIATYVIVQFLEAKAKPTEKTTCLFLFRRLTHLSSVDHWQSEQLEMKKLEIETLKRETEIQSRGAVS